MGRKRHNEAGEDMQSVYADEPEDSASGDTAIAIAPSDNRFEVQWNDKSQCFAADNHREAWAMFCDRNKVYPSPKAGKIFQNGLQVYPKE